MTAKRRPLDYRALREKISPRDVLDMFGVYYRVSTYGQGHGPCPVHGSSSDKSRSFRFNAEVWYCGGCKKTGDAVALYAALTGRTTIDAAYELCDRLGVDIPYLERR